MAIDYDVIVIGTGAGGGTLALHLARAGKKILVLERGPFMPQEKLNWDTSAVFLDNRYHTKETWQDKDGKDLHPQQAYFVGGQTKVYGAALFRMRAEDFGAIQHKGGISPAGPSRTQTWSPSTPEPKISSMFTATWGQHHRFPAVTVHRTIPLSPSTRRSTRSLPWLTNLAWSRSKTMFAS